MNTVFGIGVYRKEDYKEILRLSEDAEKMDATWEEWKKNKEKAQRNFRAIGIETKDILVRPLELVNYCRKRGLKIIGESRAQFISNKVSQLNGE